MGLWDFQLSEADQKAIDPLDLGYSEILDYGNPVLPGCSFQKKDIQDKDQIYKRRVSHRQDAYGVRCSFLFCRKALPGSLTYVILFVQKPAGRYLKFYYFPLDFLSSFSFTEP